MLNGGSLAALCSSDYAIGNDNIGGYKNDAFDQLVSNYQSATTIEEANEASKEMQKFIANEYPFITACIMTIICMHVIQACTMVGWLLKVVLL